MKDIPDDSINAIVTDPPYLYLDHKLDRPFDEDEVFQERDRILKDNGFIVLFGRGESFYRWNTKLIDLDFEFKEEVVWDKKRISSPMTRLSRVHETVSILSRGGKINTVNIPYTEHREYDIEKSF
jgi:site-specific DNA-methyltransferase (adenine-specific)